MSPATRERILGAAADLGWLPSHRARALSTSRAGAVGLVMARDAELLGADPFFPPFIAGVESVLAQHGSALVLQVVPGTRSEASAYRRLAAAGRVDGVFLTDLRVRDRRPPLMREIGLPAVTLGRAGGSDGLPAVILDDRPGIRAAVEHLAGLGHRRIAHVAGPPGFVHGAARRAAWAGALRAAGLPPGACVVGDFTAASGAKATHELLDGEAPPTAIVYANDLMAVAGLSVAAARGLAVPDQLSVVGFDDIELVAHLVPPLTTVRADVLAWGRAAATTLLATVERPAAPPSDVSLPPAQLVLRGSTATAPVTPRARELS